MTGTDILRRDSAGKAVRDLQQRLASAGFVPAGDDAGLFGPATESAVRSFQEARGIRVDGVCGPETWAAIVESGFALGDRLLYERSPNLRGDDVSELQHRLNALGFDAGREDGILGHQTAAALREFQRNTGGSVDGILGPELASLKIFAIDTLDAKGLFLHPSARAVTQTAAGAMLRVGAPAEFELRKGKETSSELVRKIGLP